MKNFIWMLLILSACSSLSKEDCASQNWFEKGKDDGEEGIELNKIDDYQKQCQEHGMKVDSKAYQEGRDKGLTSFCTYDNGYVHGLRNHTQKRNSVCPDPREFDRGYSFGQDEYRRKELKKMKEEQEKMKKELEELKRKK